MEKRELAVKIKETQGKGVSKKLRRAGSFPGIIYGNKESNTNIIVNARDFNKIITGRENEHLILAVKVMDNADSVIATKTAILKVVQRNPLNDDVMHIDLQQIALDKKIRIAVPVVLQGKAEGVKEGGVLEQLLHEIEIECLPDDIPNCITIDVSSLKLGESFHAKSLPAMDKIKIISASDTTIAVVTTIRKEEEEKTVKAETTTAAEPEIVGKKGKAEEGKEGATAPEATAAPAKSGAAKPAK